MDMALVERSKDHQDLNWQFNLAKIAWIYAAAMQIEYKGNFAILKSNICEIHVHSV